MIPPNWLPDVLNLMLFLIICPVIIWISFRQAPKWVAKCNTTPKVDLEAYLTPTPIIEILVSNRTGQVMTNTLSMHLESLIDELLGNVYGNIWTQLPLFCKRKVYTKLEKQLPYFIDDTLDQIRIKLNNKNRSGWTGLIDSNNHTDTIPEHYLSHSRSYRAQALNKSLILGSLLSMAAIILHPPFWLACIALVFLSSLPIHNGYKRLIFNKKREAIILNRPSLLTVWIEAFSVCVTEKLLSVNALIQEHSLTAAQQAIENYSTPSSALFTQAQTHRYLSTTGIGHSFNEEITSQIQLAIQTQLNALTPEKRTVLLQTIWRPFFSMSLKVALLLSLLFCFIVFLLFV